MTYRLSDRSYSKLKGVHPTLVMIVERAIQLTDIDFGVIEGLRTIAQQEEYVKKGTSKTMKSKHLRQQDGYGHAVDLAPYVGGKIPWDDRKAFARVSKAMKAAATEIGATITWGGDWKTFYDGPHYQLEI